MSTSDADGDALTYALTDLSDAVKNLITIDPQTGIISVSGAVPAELYSFKRVVSDGK